VGGWYSDYKAKLSSIAIAIASWNWAWQHMFSQKLYFLLILLGGFGHKVDLVNCYSIIKNHIFVAHFCNTRQKILPLKSKKYSLICFFWGGLIQNLGTPGTLRKRKYTINSGHYVQPECRNLLTQSKYFRWVVWLIFRVNQYMLHFLALFPPAVGNYW
jgi:hypothetical protein